MDMSRDPIKPKSVRVPDALWAAAQMRADERGEVLSEEIRKFLERYVKKSGGTRAADDLVERFRRL